MHIYLHFLPILPLQKQRKRKIYELFEKYLLIFIFTARENALTKEKIISKMIMII